MTTLRLVEGGAAAAEELRRAAAALRESARVLEEKADDLTTEPARTLLSGRDLVEAAMKVVQLHEAKHYAVILKALREIGVSAKGKDPGATLLTAIARAPEFMHANPGRRTGVYKRVR